jgi:hypothetical protein
VFFSKKKHFFLIGVNMEEDNATFAPSEEFMQIWNKQYEFFCDFEIRIVTHMKKMSTEQERMSCIRYMYENEEQESKKKILLREIVRIFNTAGGMKSWLNFYAEKAGDYDTHVLWEALYYVKTLEERLSIMEFMKNRGFFSKVADSMPFFLIQCFDHCQKIVAAHYVLQWDNSRVSEEIVLKVIKGSSDQMIRYVLFCQMFAAGVVKPEHEASIQSLFEDPDLKITIADDFRDNRVEDLREKVVPSEQAIAEFLEEMKKDGRRSFRYNPLQRRFEEVNPKLSSILARITKEDINNTRTKWMQKYTLDSIGTRYLNNNGYPLYSIGINNLQYFMMTRMGEMMLSKENSETLSDVPSLLSEENSENSSDEDDVPSLLSEEEEVN